MKKYNDDERYSFWREARCYDCGMSYIDPRWVECITSDEVWEIINPTHHKGAGLLCVQCIANRCVEANLANVKVYLSGGVLSTEDSRT